MEFRKNVETRMKTSCEQLLKIIQTLILGNKDAKTQVFLIKMKGDYYRYMAEITKDEEKIGNAEKAYKAYLEAVEIATKESLKNGKMQPTLSQIHPMRLGLMLNFSIFIFEILQNRTKATQTASEALE